MKPKLPANFPANATLLNIDDENFANQLRMTLGLEGNETAEFIFPQFARTDGKKITYLPSTVEEFDGLKTTPENYLKIAGCQIWDKENGKTHWLYPAEWYDLIPEGYIVTDINGEDEPFKKGVTEDDICFGALAYGFIAPSIMTWDWDKKGMK